MLIIDPSFAYVSGIIRDGKTVICRMHTGAPSLYAPTLM